MSKIEWTEKTWNCVSGCTWASPGCDHCYAATMTRRLEAMGQKDYAGLTSTKHFNGKIRLLEHKLQIPLKRKRPTMYFVNSMSDLFHEGVPCDFIDKVFAVMALCPQHTFQVLTKRPGRMRDYLLNVRKETVYEDQKGEKRQLVPRWYDVVSSWLDDGSAESVKKPLVVSKKWAYLHTHWITTWAGDGNMAFDCNGGVMPFEAWENDIPSMVTSKHPRADGGWFPTDVWRIKQKQKGESIGRKSNPIGK